MRYFVNPLNLEPKIFGNPGLGCSKISEACQNCFIHYFGTPIPQLDTKQLEYCSPYTFVLTCLQSDFFLKEADQYRGGAGNIIKQYPDLIFIIITKRVDRIQECLPTDGGEGYDNVMLIATAENQKRADERIPLLLNIPCKHRGITCTPCLEYITLDKYLATGLIDLVECNGEHAIDARPTYYQGFKSLSDQCKKYHVRFSVLQVGTNFISQDGSKIIDGCNCYHSEEAYKLQLDNPVPLTFYLSGKIFIKN